MIPSRTDELLTAAAWPEAEEAIAALDRNDVLITCAGFEDRALEFLRRCAAAGAKGFQLVGIKYLPEVAENRLPLLKQLSDASDAILSLRTYNRQEPEKFDELLIHSEGAERFWVDVSGMSRLLIVQLIANAVRRGLADRTRIIYIEAELYPPTREEFEKRLAENPDYLGILNFISSGVFGVTVVPELSSVAMQGQPTRLVTFPSFNPTQFAAVTAEIQASGISIINGTPPRAENQWRKDAIRQLNGIDSLGEKEEFDSSTFDYRETLKLLLDLYGRYGATQKIVVSPTGSKMQSVAVGLACGFLRDLQVVYPTPQSFPTPSNYTTGVRNVYQLSLAAFAAVPTTVGAYDVGSAEGLEQSDAAG